MRAAGQAPQAAGCPIAPVATKMRTSQAQGGSCSHHFATQASARVLKVRLNRRPAAAAIPKSEAASEVDDAIVGYIAKLAKAAQRLATVELRSCTMKLDNHLATLAEDLDDACESWDEVRLKEVTSRKEAEAGSSIGGQLGQGGAT